MASINLQFQDGGGDDSSRSPVRSGTASSPWSKIVQGESGELSLPVVSVTPPTASPSSPSVQEHVANPSSYCSPPKSVPETENSPDDSGTDCHSEGSGNGGNAIKKPVWSKPSNGVVEVVSPVMGAVSWPALGEKPSSNKSTSSESLPALSDASLLPPLQVPGNPSLSPHKLASANHVNPASTPNHVAPSGQRSIRRGGGAYASSNGGFSQRSPAAIQDSKVESHPRKPAMDSFTKEQRGGFGSQANSGNSNEHHHQRNSSSYRRGNNGGQYPRGNQEWNQHQHQHRSSFNNMQQQAQRGGFRRGGGGGFVRPSVHTSTPFIPSPQQQMHLQLGPFGNGFMYPMADMANAMFYVQGPNPPVPMMQPPMYYPVPDPDLNKKIVKQIEYYFSDENLVKDFYLRQNMDEQGWVPASLIAGFKKVSILTDNVQLIIDVMRTSKDVEVQGDKMRSRNEWMKFVFRSTLNQDSLASQLRGIGLDDVATKNQAVV